MNWTDKSNVHDALVVAAFGAAVVLSLVGFAALGVAAIGAVSWADGSLELDPSAPPALGQARVYQMNGSSVDSPAMLALWFTTLLLIAAGCAAAVWLIGRFGPRATMREWERERRGFEVIVRS